MPSTLRRNMKRLNDIRHPRDCFRINKTKKTAEIKRLIIGSLSKMMLSSFGISTFAFIIGRSLLPLYVRVVTISPSISGMQMLKMCASLAHSESETMCVDYYAFKTIAKTTSAEYSQVGIYANGAWRSRRANKFHAIKFHGSFSRRKINGA